MLLLLIWLRLLVCLDRFYATHESYELFCVLSFLFADEDHAFALFDCFIDISLFSCGIGSFCCFFFDLSSAVELVGFLDGGSSIEDPDGFGVEFFAEDGAVEHADEVFGEVAGGVGGHVDSGPGVGWVRGRY